MKKFLILFGLMCAPGLLSAQTIATITVQLQNLSTTAAQASLNAVRVDLQNCPAPRIPGTAYINEKQWVFQPNSTGLVTATIFPSAIINCGGSATNSYYTFNFVSNGTVTSLGSFIIPSGTHDLSTLTPIYTVPTVATPTGDSTYLRLDLGNFGNMVQPIPYTSIQGTNSTLGYRYGGAAPNQHCLLGNGSYYVDSGACLTTTSANYVVSFNGRQNAVLPASGDYSFSLLSGTLGSTQTSAGTTYPMNISGTAAAFTATPTQCSGTQVAKGIAANGNANCANLTHSVAAVSNFTSCALVHYGDTDQNCAGTATWSSAITGSYTTVCTINTGFMGGGADSVGTSQTTFGINGTTSTGFGYYIANIHDGAAGATVNFTCAALQ